MAPLPPGVLSAPRNAANGHRADVPENIGAETESGPW